MKLSPAIHQFFDRYLPHIKGVSDHTLKAYRDAFKLFLIFAADYYGIKIKSLRLEHITSEFLLAFLDDLQSQRRNLARTRNQRLAALKSFAKMIRLLYPEHREVAETIFSVPLKRTQKTLVGFLYPDEILNVFHCGQPETKRRLPRLRHPPPPL
jgi:integrase/recombinase XerD